MSRSGSSLSRILSSMSRLEELRIYNESLFDLGFIMSYVG